MFDFFGPLLVIVAYLAFMARRLLTYLHIFQQEEYDEDRLYKWILKNRVFDKKLSAALLVLTVIWFFAGLEFLILPLTLVAFGVAFIIEKDPRREGKKRLVITERARKIFLVALGIMTVPALLAFVSKLPLLWVVLVQIAPIALGLARRVLQKEEDAVQQKYWDQAVAKMAEVKPIIIGVTGSFGKTSVKHILGHILEMQGKTLITPGSINTPMGITRIIREQLLADHQYFVVEMGAYGPGSIARLCELTPPDHGIITAIGHAHYERFETLDKVAKAKFELAQAVINKGGTMVVGEKTLKFDHSRNMFLNNTGHFKVVGDDGDNALIIMNVYQKQEGIEVKVRWAGKAYTLKAHLYGSHHGENMAIAFAMACTLGIEPKNVIAALSSVPQIRHRLEVKQTEGRTKATIIDDAYNANPRGFRTALDLLDLLATKPDGKKFRRILITPGMVELGHAHDEQHRQIGEYAFDRTDIVILINPQRIPTFAQGYRAANTGPEDEAVIFEKSSFAEAQRWMHENMRPGDTILIENDLPDLYERVPKF